MVALGGSSFDLILWHQKGLAEFVIASQPDVVHRLNGAAVDGRDIGMDDVGTLRAEGADGCDVFGEACEDAAVENEIKGLVQLPCSVKSTASVLLPPTSKAARRWRCSIRFLRGCHTVMHEKTPAPLGEAGVGYFLRSGLFIGDHLDDEQGRDGEHDAQRQADPDVLDEAGDDEHHKGDGSHGDGIRHLGRNVIEVITLTAGRGHDGRVGDGGAVVAANSAGQTSGHTDDKELGACGEDGGNDRD